MPDAPQTPKRNRGPIAWMAGHSISANLLMAILLICGFVMAKNIKKELFPEFDLDMIFIRMVYPGASPEEIERGILLAIEEAVQDLDGVEEVTASAREGSGSVTIEVLDGVDVQQVARDVKNEVDRIVSFPLEAEEPEVTVASRRRSVVELALFGEQNEWVLREMAEIVRDRLLSDEQITQVDLQGVRDYEIAIEIPQNTLRKYNLTLGAVAQIIRNTAVELPGGAIRAATGDVLVRVKERRDYGREFGKIPIITANDGTEVLLEDIAKITDGFADTDQYATFNGKRAVMLQVYRVGEQTPITVSDAVFQKMSEINAILPPGLKLEARNDRSQWYRQRLDLMLKNGFIGLGLVFILLAIFLEARLAFWVSLGIPISILGSFLMLPFLGVSINVVTMFAFIVTLGIVVDDAIVAGENIYHHRQQGLEWYPAAIKGAREVAMPVTFSVLSNMVAFMPILFVPGFMGKVFRVIPLVVICVFAISLVESLFILPAHLGHHRDRGEKGPLSRLFKLQQRFSVFFKNQVRTKYGPFLSLALRGRYVTLSIGIAILIITLAYIKSGRLGFELFPKLESDFAVATATLPFGSAVQKTEQIQAKLVNTAREIADQYEADNLVEGIYARINGNVTKVQIYLAQPDVRPISTAQVTRIWREKVGNLAGLENIKFESDAGGPGRGAALAVELSHRDIKVLERASRDLAAALAYFPNAIDIDDGFSQGKQQIDFKMKPEGRSLGLQSAEIARQIRHAYYGAEALRQQRGRNEVKVKVRLPESERMSEFSLEEMILRSPAGKEIALREAVNLSRGRAYTTIDRRKGRRIVTVQADARPRSRAGQILRSLQTDVLPDLKKRYPGLTVSFEGRQADRRESMQSLIRGLIYALFVIYAMLAVPFNSYIQPMIIMVCIPFGVVGAIIGHLIMGFSLSVISMFGVVALSGVVVNDSLILIDFANRRRRSGMGPMEAIHEAAIQRFRPILLTTLTTFGGLSPMIFETNRHARFLIPMAISLGYGIVFATLITLVLVPALYMLVEDMRLLIRSEKSQISP